MKYIGPLCVRALLGSHGHRQRMKENQSHHGYIERKKDGEGEAERERERKREREREGQREIRLVQ